MREPTWHAPRCLRLASPRVNLYVFGPDCPETIRHRLFRDWRPEHPDDRERYVRAKRAAIPGSGTVGEYNLRKQAVIRDIYDRVTREGMFVAMVETDAGPCAPGARGHPLATQPQRFCC